MSDGTERGAQQGLSEEELLETIKQFLNSDDFDGPKQQSSEKVLEEALSKRPANAA